MYHIVLNPAKLFPLLHAKGFALLSALYMPISLAKRKASAESLWKGRGWVLQIN